jgi:hypothetical protein
MKRKCFSSPRPFGTSSTFKLGLSPIADYQNIP